LLYIIRANLCSIITTLYVLLLLYNLGCTIEYVIYNELWDPQYVEQLAVLYYTDSPLTVEGYSTVKAGDHVLLSSTGGEGSNSNAPNTGSGHSSAANYLSSQNVSENVEVFETIKETFHTGKELRKECNGDTHSMFDKSKDLIRDVDAEKEKLLTHIASEKEEGNISEAEASNLQNRVIQATDEQRVLIKETNNTSVEYIDEDAEDCLFRHADHPWDTDEDTTDTDEDSSSISEDNSDTED